MGYLFNFVIVCFLGVTFTSGTYICNDGVECINLKDCVGLYRQWQENKNETISLIRMLLCRHEDAPKRIVKVCCPAELYLSNATNRATPVGRKIDAVHKIALLQNITCGSQNGDKIFGGTRAQLDEHPWMALLRYDNGNRTEYFCGGVLISSRHVLTAAHCVKGLSLPPLWKLTQVRLGEWNTSSAKDCSDDLCSEVIEVSVEETITHELFNPNDVNLLNDIAILKLSQEVQFTDFVKPICLPTDPDLLHNTFAQYDLEVAGWGKTEESSSSDVKLKVRLPVINNKICQDQYNRVRRIVIDKQLCAGGRGGQDSCRGDSGGALMGELSKQNKWTVVGVVSYGPNPCGTSGWPGVYTRVTSYIDWIISNMSL